MNSKGKPPQQSEEHVNFTCDELALMADIRSWVETKTRDFNPQMKHRLLLGAASEMVDAAADLAALHRPGVRVIELGLLAERIAHLACAPLEPTDN